jgi:hypothetical protein
MKEWLDKWKCLGPNRWSSMILYHPDPVDATESLMLIRALENAFLDYQHHLNNSNIVVPT